jgi:hypothetical protein
MPVSLLVRGSKEEYGGDGDIPSVSPPCWARCRAAIATVFELRHRLKAKLLCDGGVLAVLMTASHSAKATLRLWFLHKLYTMRIV